MRSTPAPGARGCRTSPRASSTILLRARDDDSGASVIENDAVAVKRWHRHCYALRGATHSGGGLHEEITRWNVRVRSHRHAGQRLHGIAVEPEQRAAEPLAIGVTDHGAAAARQFARELV